MITFIQAEVKAKEILAQNSSADYNLVITKVTTLDYGWIFSYTSDKFLKTQSISDALAGNAPFLIQLNGGVHYFGTAQTLEEYLVEYENNVRHM